MRRMTGWVFGCALASAAAAQDSVSKTPCLPGDAVSPWAASEQCNSYVVDLAPLTTAWGREFGIAPLVKSSKSASAFFNGFWSAQGLSRVQLQGVPAASPSYSFWNAPGLGINDDGAVNDPGAPLSPAGATHQFCLVAADAGTTDAAASFNGVIGAIVNYEPAAPTRLYVKRVVVATNSCDSASNVSQFGLGAVDASGNAMIRADGVGSAAACGLTALTGNNYYRVGLGQRDCAALNILSGSFPAGADAAATEWLVRGSTVTHNTPAALPAEVNGGTSFILGSNFNREFVRGPDFAGMTSDLTHLCGTDHRGALAYTTRNHPLVASTHGMGCILGKSAASGNPTELLNVFGLNAAGNVTGTLCLLLPQTITDCRGGAPSIPPAPMQFDHYRSQTAFRGGNSPVAIGVDRAGNLLAAGIVYNGTQALDDPANFIAVARAAPDGTVQWTIAAMNWGAATQILDGPGGTPIGQLTQLFNVTGGVPFGPSMSAPIFDSVGNIYFLSAIEDYATGDFTNALVCAVYDEANFCYELDLVFKLGDVFPGMNSGREWLISFLSIADSNSVASDSAWSMNGSEAAHLGGAPDPNAPASAPENLGGLVIAAEIVYDWDGDGSFDPCTGGGTGTADQDYNVLLYLGARTPGQAPCEPCDTDCNGTVNGQDIDDFIDVLNGGPGCSPCAADADGNGSTNGQDIDDFIDCLNNP